jgi:serine/threonine-protein kinase
MEGTQTKSSRRPKKKGRRRGRLRHPKRVGPYVLESVLGWGAMGVVYRAWDTAAKRPVAVKTLTCKADGTAWARFRREAALAAATRHPGVVRVHALVKGKGRVYLVTELIEGARGLGAAFEALGDDHRGKASLVAEAARAVGCAHQKGIVHRDLKPENILVDRAGRVRVADFGLATKADLSRLTQVGAVVGTPTYMAPELIGLVGVDRRLPVTPRTDVWALGVLLYEALTGRQPYVAESLVELMIQVESERPTPVETLNPGVWRELAAVCEKALARDPQGRYADGAEFAEALEAACAARRPRLTLERWLCGAAALLLVAASALGGARPADAVTAEVQPTVSRSIAAPAAAQSVKDALQEEAPGLEDEARALGAVLCGAGEAGR